MVEAPGPPSPAFSFIAGHLALDLANTVDWHAAASPLDRLKRYSDFLAWAQQAETISPGSAHKLDALGRAHPAQARAAMKVVRLTRESIYQAFAAIAARRAPPPHALAAVRHAVQEAASHGRLRWTSGGIWFWNGRHDLLRPLWPVVWAASQLLTSADAGRVRQCRSDDGCGWLFIDRSKNGTRRWCSMAVCGNRAKARRHYDRTRADRTGL